MSKEAMKLALEALKRMKRYGNTFAYRSHEQNPYEQVCEAIAALEALAEQPAQQEPVAWMHTMDNTEGHKANKPYVLFTKSKRNPFGVAGRDYSKSYPVTKQPLYTSPSAQQEPVAGQPLPCPFCGHIGLDFADGETYRWGVASCGGCGATCGDVRREYPDKGEWHTEAIVEWNKRSPAAQRTWVGLTDEEITDMWAESSPYYHEDDFARAIEAKLRSKNEDRN